MAKRGGRSYIYYTPNGGNTLLDAIQHHNNARNRYYFQVPAPSKAKTTLRSIHSFEHFRKAGPNIHPMAEFNMSAWRQRGGNWFNKGRQFRQEMIDAGIPNTTWDINESGSGVRDKNPLARRQLMNLVRGLYGGHHSGIAPDKGMIFQQGPGYRDGLQPFLHDNKFWKVMGNDVSQYIPEAYATPKRYYTWSPAARHHYLTGSLSPGKMETPMLSALWNKRGTGAWGTPKSTGLPIPKMMKFIRDESRPFQKSHAISYVWNEHPNNFDTNPKVETNLQDLAKQLALMSMRR